MPGNNAFKIAVAVSLFIHGVVLFQNSRLNIFSPNRTEKNIEVRYVKPEQENKTDLKSQPVKREPFLKLPPKITADRRLPPPLIEKDDIFKNNPAMAKREPAFARPALDKTDILAIKKKITLPPIDLQKINNPSYIGYYQIVREKIKRSAYQNYTGREEGEITVAFVIAAFGELVDLRVVEEKSTTSSYLKEVAIKSLKEASSFPVFPSELNYPELSFTLPIKFEVE